MRIVGDLVPTMTRKKTHRLLLISLLLALIVLFTGWYLVASLQREAAQTASLHPALLFPAAAAPSPMVVPATGASISNSNIKIDTAQSMTGTAAPSARININGQQIPVPQTGAVHQVIQNSDGATTVDVSVNADSATANVDNASTNIQLNSTTESTVSSQAGP